MTTFIRNLSMTLALAAGAMSLNAAPAAADNGVSFGIVIGDGYRDGGYRGRDDDHYRDDYRRGPPRHERRHAEFCPANRALREASRLGIRRPYVAHESRRAITVVSGRNGAEVRFAQRRDCPVISYRR